jgi:hypothetical protein
LTRDLSSGGVAFDSDAELPIGEIIELWITWPAAAEETSCMKLRIAGRVVRSLGVATAIQTKRHDFVTCRKSSEGGNESDQTTSPGVLN